MGNLILFNYKRIIKSKFAIILAVIMIFGVGILSIVLSTNKDIIIEITNNNLNSEFLLTYVLLMFYYILIIFTGSILVTSIASEKIQKTLDLLTYKITPHKIIMSKIYAVLAFLASLFTIILFEFISINSFLDVININGSINCLIVIKGVIIFGVGFLAQLYIYVFCAIGVKNTSQLQTAQFPAAIISFIIFILGIYSLIYQNNPIIKILSYLPVISAFIGVKSIIVDKMAGFYMSYFILINILFIIFCNGIVNKYIKKRY